MPDDGSNVVVRPARGVSGVVRIPGDKSISHRYAMLAAIAEGTSRFQNFSAARDCASTLDCMAKLGCAWTRLEDGAIEVRGVGPRLTPPTEVLDCGNSGSTMRMLSGIVAGQKFTSEMIGDESLSRRPMERMGEPREGWRGPDQGDPREGMRQRRFEQRGDHDDDGPLGEHGDPMNHDRTDRNTSTEPL